MLAIHVQTLRLLPLIRLLVVGGLMAAIVPAQAGDWQRVRSGVQLFRVSAWQEAADALTPLVEGKQRVGKSARAPAAYVLARARAALKDGPGARKALKLAAKVKGVYGPAWRFAEVEVLLAEGKKAAAFKKLTALRKAAPKFRWAQADIVWARLYEQVGPPRAAAEACLQLYGKSRLHLPQDELLARAARLLRKVGDNKRAHALWKKLLMVHPESALIDQALAHVKLSSLSDAERLKRAEVLFAKRDYERCRVESLYLWNKGLHKRDVGYFLGKIGSERLRDDYPNSVKYFEAAIVEGAPYAMFALSSYGIALAKVGRHADGIKAFDLWLKRYKGQKMRRVNEAMYDRCRAIRAWGKPLRAAEEYKPFLERHRKGYDWGKYWWFVGYWTYLGGKYEESIKLFKPLMRSWNPLVGGKARYWTGKALEKLGRKKQAAEVWRKLVWDQPLNYYSGMAEQHLRKMGLARKLPKMPDLSRVPFRARAPFRGLPKKGAVARLRLAAHMGEYDTLREVLKAQQPRLHRQLGKERTKQLISDLSDELEDFWTDRGRSYYKWRKDLRKWPTKATVHKWRGIYPRAYHTHVTYWAKKYGAPEWMVYAHMLQESRYKPWMISNAPAYGLLELLDRTARRLAAEKKDDYQLWMLMRPSYNIQWGTQYLGALYRKFHGQLPFAICSYNGGPMLLEHHMRQTKGQDYDVMIDDLSTHQARNYVRMVIGHFLRYLAIYEKPKRAAELREQLLLRTWKAEWLKDPDY
ncbi:MAG: transglycosylase SLT domain-containing protein [Myxococcales bacterium]|nr:transglycosylase SLT domain-containing protein [Myxococcales bacterium]